MIDYIYKILAKILINYSYAFGFVWKKKRYCFCEKVKAIII